MTRRLRSGYTTGACAAAAAKGAALFLTTGTLPGSVEIPFPDGSRHMFMLKNGTCENMKDGSKVAIASVIKDAGDDPDVTNGAEIVAGIRYVKAAGQVSDSCVRSSDKHILICGGEGVGRVTKPGLAVKVGEPAINPVPREMIAAAVLEGLKEETNRPVMVTISVPRGRELAEKTLNHRLGILGGLSILGTTGIVRPVSAEAWTATIQASLDVAKAAGLKDVVLSTGRTSEKGAQNLLRLPEEACVMMGDYLEFSLKEAAQRGFERIHLAGMWAKIMKAALEISQTHVRHGRLEVENALAILSQAGAEKDLLDMLQGANTAREIYENLQKMERGDLVREICRRAKGYAEQITGLPVHVYLVSSGCKVVEHV